MTEYIFILGQATTLAKQEIISILGLDNIKTIGPNFIIASTKYPLKELMSVLGGTIKIAVLKEEIDNLEELTTNKWKSYLTLQKQTKNHFGFSLYDSPRPDYAKLKKTALSLKKELKEEKYKARLVSSKALDLSSVIVAKNKLINAELVIIKYDNKYILGITKVVQDFVKYGWRDIKRPGRDMKSGMLPPKVAQMMINLAGNNRDITILDPFCGSGTILQEALLLNFSQIYGRDVSPKAIDNSIKNIDWLKKNLSLNKSVDIKQVDVKNLARDFEDNSIDLIVTEPFMGDASFVQKSNNIQELEILSKELQQLYITAFTKFKKILTKNAKVIFIFPIFNLDNKKIYTLNKEAIEQLGFNHIKPNIKSDKLSVNNNLVYTRPQQKVHREIAIWQNK